MQFKTPPSLAILYSLNIFETSSKGQKDFTLTPKEFSLFSNTI